MRGNPVKLGKDTPIEFYWVLLGFNGLDWVLRGFTWFYRVSLGF